MTTSHGQLLGDRPHQDKQYRFSAVLNVPNPYGVPFEFRPGVQMTGLLPNSLSEVSGPIATIQDPALDSGTPGRGVVTFSVDQTTHTWIRWHDQAADLAYAGTLRVPEEPTLYDFDGFFQPIDMNGVWNRVKAGRAIPVKFSLDGYQGMDVLSSASPNPTFIVGACPSGDPIDTIEQTVTAGGSSLSYDPVADQYVYVWKTDKNWAGRCGTLTVNLADGTPHSALFALTR